MASASFQQKKKKNVAERIIQLSDEIKVHAQSNSTRATKRTTQMEIREVKFEQTCMKVKIDQNGGCAMKITYGEEAAMSF